MKLYLIKYKDSGTYHKKVWVNPGHLKLHLRTCKLRSISNHHWDEEEQEEDKKFNKKILDNIEMHIIDVEEHPPVVVQLELDDKNEWNV